MTTQTDDTIEPLKAEPWRPVTSSLHSRTATATVEAVERAPANILEELRSILDDGVARATQRIEIYMTSRRRASNIMFGYQVWALGLRIRGGGDELQFVCRVQRDKVSMLTPGKSRGCGRYIPSEQEVKTTKSGTVIVVCPHCKTAWNRDMLSDMQWFSGSVQDAAALIASVWRSEGCRSDIRIIHNMIDTQAIRFQKTIEEGRLSMQDARDARDIKAAMDKSLRDNGKREAGVTYLLDAILKDTQSGSSVESVLRAFLSA